MKNYKIAFTQRAKEDMSEIYKYIALDNPARANTLINGIKILINKNLSIFPCSGRLVEDYYLDQEVRILSYGRYNIYYHVIDDREVVEILFVLNSSRDTSSIMKGYY